MDVVQALLHRVENLEQEMKDQQELFGRVIGLMDKHLEMIKGLTEAVERLSERMGM
jgi:hypothetical protein